MSVVHQMILERGAADPAGIAATASDAVLTYEKLVAGTSAVAGTLREAGVGAEEIVALCGPRSLDGLIGMLGILTAGGAYLYLDPALPDDRLRFMLEECGVRIAVTTGGPGPAGCEAIPIAAAASTKARRSAVAPRSRVGPKSLAYVVYTSGSTGRPKGVAVEHGGVVNMARQLARVLDVTAGTRVLQFSSWSWDASAGEIFVTLAAGATLVLAPDTVRHGGHDLADLIRARRVEVLTLTPSVLSATPVDDLPDLHTVVAVGETCPPEAVSRWSAPGRRFLNGYGPTEATVAVSVGDCRPGEDVHIGTPLPGVRTIVVDDQDRPVLPGQPGELLVGGAGIARRYIGHADDVGRFFADADGARWFRTRDRVSRCWDGKLVHLGRLDDQVQLRGHRIELGEVEHTLRRHPSVRACAATVRGGRLVAHVVASPSLDAASLTATARNWLPEHMLPDIRFVERLPQTSNGKVDRVRLAQDNDESTGVVLDVVLAAIRDSLETQAVGPDDNFFDIGGHSLLAARLSVTLADRLGIDLPVLTIFDNPTASQLADVIRGAQVEA